MGNTVKIGCVGLIHEPYRMSSSCGRPTHGPAPPSSAVWGCKLKHGGGCKFDSAEAGARRQAPDSAEAGPDGGTDVRMQGFATLWGMGESGKHVTSFREGVNDLC
jgi:hypothetical protein